MATYTPDSKQFFTALQDGKLIGSACIDCGQVMIPQRVICGRCHSDNTEIVEFVGEGVLSAFTIINVPPTAMAEAGYSTKNPYCSGIVTLTEGPRISAQILNVDVNNPQTIKIGSLVRMTTIEREPNGENKIFLAFEVV
jgi:uncharacterized OB-fold protein